MCFRSQASLVPGFEFCIVLLVTHTAPDKISQELPSKVPKQSLWPRSLRATPSRTQWQNESQYRRFVHLWFLFLKRSHPSSKRASRMAASDKHLYTPSNLKLPRPDFSFDSDDNDLELWTFRLPTNVPLSSLNELEIDLNGNNAPFEVGDRKYKITVGDKVDNESFRVLVPAEDDLSESSDSDKYDDDDDDKTSEKQELLQPSSLPFARHWNVVSAIPELSERDLAPREGPPPVDKMRTAYSHVPQRTGLKRRWMPMGVKFESSVSDVATKQQVEDNGSEKGESKQTKRVKREAKAITPSSIEDDHDKDTSTPSIRSDKKAMKAEKKAAKKAKKEAKKAKKEKRKSK
eukprot:scaffold3857_cov127-Cylindrotheca_fusiformis.AAC.1